MKQLKIDALCQKISKEKLYELYVVQNTPFNQLYDKLDITRRDLRRLLTAYGIKKDPKLRAKNNGYVRPAEVIRQVALKSSIKQKKD